MNLSYERLLSVLNQLSEEDGKYVLAFVLNSERKAVNAVKKLREMEDSFLEEKRYLRRRYAPRGRA